MRTIKRILVPCDFSEASRHAVLHAGSLAAAFRAELIGLHVHFVPLMPLGDFSYLPPPPQLSAQARTQLLSDLRRFIEPAAIADVPRRCEVVEGDPVQEIIERAKASEADLIVMGTHGRRGFERWALGSVTERVVRRAGCSVMTVTERAAAPAPLGQVRYERIVCGIDFSPGSQQALAWAIETARSMKAHLTIVHVAESRASDRTEADLRELVAAQSKDQVETSTRIVFGRAHEQLLAVAEEDRSELIVIGAHGQSAFDLLRLGSHAHLVLRSALCPVLTVR